MSSHHPSPFPRPNVPTDVPAIKVPHAGAGQIGRTTALAVAILFLLGICIPGIYQTWYDETVLGRSEFQDLLARFPTADSLKQFESNLTQQSRFDRWVRHTFWHAMTGGIIPPRGVQLARDGWLFSDEELRPYNSFSLNDPAPSPASTIMPAILSLKQQLDAQHPPGSSPHPRQARNLSRQACHRLPPFARPGGSPRIFRLAQPRA